MNSNEPGDAAGHGLEHIAHKPDWRENIGANPTSNPAIGEVIEARLSRRAALLGIAGAGAATTLVDQLLGGTGAVAQPAGPSSLTFTEIPHQMSARDAVAPGYEIQVLLRWGDPILPGAPAYDPNRVTAEAQAGQFGYNCDYLDFFPLPQGSDSSDHGLLAVNHEYTNTNLMFPGIGAGREARGRTNAAQVAAEIQAHGMSVVEVRKVSNKWEYVRSSRYNRRLPMTEPMRISGPAAGDARMRTSADPTGTRVLGTLNNCAGGNTPWGTVLTGEENFNQYFGGDRARTPHKESFDRYTVAGSATSYNWHTHVDRFNIEKEPNEPFRFGWVVEFDPYDPASVPVKRTALGRFKHEGAETSLAADGRVVMYMGDDERFDYIYKFVTRGRFNPQNRAANMSLLDEGTLYVAKYNPDGSGEWLPLVQGNGPLTAANGFSTQADVCIKTRQAADLLGATKMDRPEDVERNPVTGMVYPVMTNNSRRTAAQVDPMNPRADNRDGHIIEMMEEGNDAAATRFRWTMFMVCGDPTNAGTYFAGFDKTKVSPVATPDCIAFDRAGNMWIATDGMENSNVKGNDGVFAVPTRGPERGFVRQFMSAPKGAEVCGPIFAQDDRAFFAGIQHPGEGGTVEKPVSLWPDGRGVPRPSVVAVRKNDGGIIGG